MNKNKTTSNKAKDSKYDKTKSKIQTDKDAIHLDPTSQLNRGRGPKNQKR